MSALFKIILLVLFSFSLMSCGGGADKNPLPEDSIRPGAPRDVKALPGNGLVIIVWSLPASIGKPDYYILEKSIDDQKTFTTVSRNIAANDINYTDNNAQNDIPHVYRIAAVNEIGIGAWAVSDVITPAVTKKVNVPGEPQNVVAIAGNASVTVNWKVPLTGEAAYYRVARKIDNQELIKISGQIPGDTTTFTDPKAKNGLSHVYFVTAENSLNVQGISATSNAVIPNTGETGTPSTPLDFIALADNNSVTLNWTAGLNGGATTNYKIEKSSDKQQTFTPVDLLVPIDVFSLADSMVINGVSLVYRIIATNDVGDSPALLSNIVIPTLGNASSTRITLISEQPAKFNNFGNTFVFHPDGATIAIGEVGRSGANNTRPGAVQLFTRLNNVWGYAQTLTTTATGNTESFGDTVAFSSDGLTLAVGGEFNGQTGDTIYIYTRPVDSWVKSQTITLAAKVKTGFGSSLAFNADNTTLAIGEKYGLANSIMTGVVHIYEFDGNNWQPAITGAILESNLAAANNEFGAIVRFSPDGSTLAIAEKLGDSATIDNVGTVQLFTKSGSTWLYASTLFSDVPALNNYFGSNNDYNNDLLFSPDSTILAIGEIRGDVVAGDNVGKLHLFSKAGTIWNPTQVLNAQSQESRGFGNTVSFSADGNSLAIGESAAGESQVGIVHIFNLTNTITTPWLFSKKLTAIIPGDRNKFGSRVVFNTVGTTLAVGEIQGDTATVSNVGVVDIIELTPGL